MKKLTLLLVFISFVGSVTAQKNTLQKASLDSEIKALLKNPAQYKALKEEDRYLKQEVATHQLVLEQMRDEEVRAKSRLLEQDQQIALLRQEINQLSMRLTSPAVVASGKAFFRVQIGAYRNANLASALAENARFFIEDHPNQMKRFLLGNFASYWEAQRLVDKLKKEGAQAFVVGYLNNTRLANLKEMPQEYF
ncbi:MAG: hypothetical protein OHK0053_35250 [Microscillaceae bacterium]